MNQSQAVVADDEIMFATPLRLVTRTVVYSNDSICFANVSDQQTAIESID
jgi:hypothetical protein